MHMYGAGPVFAAGMALVGGECHGCCSGLAAGWHTDTMLQTHGLSSGTAHKTLNHCHGDVFRCPVWQLCAMEPTEPWSAPHPTRSPPQPEVENAIRAPAISTTSPTVSRSRCCGGVRQGFGADLGADLDADLNRRSTVRRDVSMLC